MHTKTSTVSLIKRSWVGEESCCEPHKYKKKSHRLACSMCAISDYPLLHGSWLQSLLLDWLRFVPVFFCRVLGSAILALDNFGRKCSSTIAVGFCLRAHERFLIIVLNVCFFGVHHRSAKMRDRREDRTSNLQTQELAIYFLVYLLCKKSAVTTYYFVSMCVRSIRSRCLTAQREGSLRQEFRVTNAIHQSLSKKNMICVLLIVELIFISATHVTSFSQSVRARHLEKSVNLTRFTCLGRLLDNSAGLEKRDQNRTRALKQLIEPD